MDEWLEEAARALEVPALEPAQAGALLKATRLVAHGVERRFAPLAAFLVGAAVERRVAVGTDRDEALREALTAIRRLIPDGTAITEGPPAG